MEILHLILLFFHLIGMAIIVGCYFATLRNPRVLPGMLHGAYLQLVTGLLLVLVLELGSDDINHMKIGIKILLALAVTICAFIGVRKDKRAGITGSGRSATTSRAPSAVLSHITAALAILTVAVAVFV